MVLSDYYRAWPAGGYYGMGPYTDLSVPDEPKPLKLASFDDVSSDEEIDVGDYSDDQVFVRSDGSEGRSRASSTSGYESQSCSSEEDSALNLCLAASPEPEVFTRTPSPQISNCSQDIPCPESAPPPDVTPNCPDDCLPPEQRPERPTVLVHARRDPVFCPEDLALRSRVLVLLWVLLGEQRLREVGYPLDPVHRVLWRAVDVCCSVAGVKTAAAVPLNADHDCGSDMACFRDHAHRFLEVCAPTREHWKQFGWASLTVDAVVRKIYLEELEPLLRLRGGALPPDIEAAHLAQLDRPSPRPPPTSTSVHDHRPQQPLVPAKKKRGRPAKVSHKVGEQEGGRVERVMLWRFLLNLLEDPLSSHQACLHWVQRDEGIFRILNTDWLARLWGRRHGNPRMTYEKMARAMRTYYRSKVLQPVPRLRNLPRKLVYKFNPAVIQKVAAMKLTCSTFTGRGLNYNK